jgi:hypothetical protein
MTTSAAPRLTGWRSDGLVAGRLVYVASELTGEGIAVYDYRTGRISRNRLVVRSAGPAAELASVGAGAIIGAWVGA